MGLKLLLTGTFGEVEAEVVKDIEALVAKYRDKVESALVTSEAGTTELAAPPVVEPPAPAAPEAPAPDPAVGALAAEVATMQGQITSILSAVEALAAPKA